AVAQLIDWVLPAVQELVGPLEVAGYSRLKFIERVRPGQALSLRLERKDAERVSFELSEGAQRFASGSLSLRPARR
ncbi:MAG TPA: hypothetical protein VLC09_20815, partial [Polyangiaceae bacterium]|nr:hypothetical protein [Polyangiaceae bacterium]